LHSHYLKNKFFHQVDVIHTAAWSYGAPVNTGTIDFWVNGGVNIFSVQPGCPARNYFPLSDTDGCSHFRSWQLYAESVAKPRKPFYARQCLTWFNFNFGICKHNNVVEMGINCPEE
jgi:hypothetical protein